MAERHRSTTYASGKKTGPYQTFYVSGTLAEEGHYLDGDKDGISKSYDDNGSVKATFKRRQGVLEGPASVSSKCGNHQLQFADGRLVAVDGRAVENRLGALADSDKIESLRAREILAGVQGCAFIGLPLSTTTDTLSRLFNVPFVADEQHVDPKIPVDFCGHDISLASALAAMATLHDLHCDYRYGAIWITSPENGEDWRDPTGISEILPPTESPLAAVWNEPVNSSMAGTPLSAALNQLAASKAVNIDVSQITANRGEAQAYQVQRNFVEHPFRHVLGIFLYEARCRCRLEGETLVILPQN